MAAKMRKQNLCIFIFQELFIIAVTDNTADSFVKGCLILRLSKSIQKYKISTTKEYICDDDWTIREITPSEGYLLDTTIHKVGAEPQLYTVEHNQTANDVTEQITLQEPLCPHRLGILFLLHGH